MDKNKMFVFSLVSFSLGVLGASFHFLGKVEAILFLMIFILLCLLFYYGKLTMKGFFILFFCFVLGFFRFYLGAEENHNEDLFLGKKLEIEGTIALEPDNRGDHIKYILKDIEIIEQKLFLEGRMIIKGPVSPEFLFGDRISFFGKIEKPFSTFEFSYEEFLYRYDVYWIAKAPSAIRVISPSSSWNFVFLKLFEFKDFSINRLANLFGEPYSSFMSGILLGLRKGFSKELTEDFKNSGLTHIVAVSGYNITILIVFVYGLFSFFSRNKRIFIAISFIVIFVFLTGLSASAVRAGIMGVVSLLALLTGKNYNVKIALFFSGFLMVLIEPKILYYDIGFQLSFLATIGLIYVSPMIEKYFSFLPNVLEIRDSLVLTIASTISTLPIIAMNFGLISLISPIANLLVLPLIPVIMLFSAISLFVSFILIELSLPFAFCAFFLTKYVFFVITFLGNMQYGTLTVESIPVIFWFLVFLYVFFEIVANEDLMLEKERVARELEAMAGKEGRERGFEGVAGKEGGGGAYWDLGEEQGAVVDGNKPDFIDVGQNVGNKKSNIVSKFSGIYFDFEKK